MSLTTEFSKSIEYWSELAARVPAEERSSALHIVEGLMELALKVSAIESGYYSKVLAATFSKWHDDLPDGGNGTLH